MPTYVGMTGGTGLQTYNGMTGGTGDRKSVV